MDVYVATKNAGKLRELRAIFAAYGWNLETFDGYEDVVEGANSYEENAALKARALRRQLEGSGICVPVLGDDSGLEVDALDGRPGVLSARYGGPNATWLQRRRALLQEVAESGRERTAAFVCALHFIGVDGRETAVLRRLSGEIARGERGSGGFSYDPVFWYPPLGATFGELDEARKNALSHRALAARALAEAIALQAAAMKAQNVGPNGT